MKKICSPSPLLRLIPYLAAVVLFVATALLVPVLRLSSIDGYLAEPSQASNLLAYLPLAAGYLLLAYFVSGILFGKEGKSEKRSQDKENRVALLPLALSVVCLVFGIGFSTAFDYVKGNKIIHKGVFFTNQGWSTVLESTPWELTDDDVYVLKFQNRTVRVKKYSDAGKELEKTLFPKG